VIEFLLAENRDIEGRVFATKNGEKINWNKTISGRNKYLAGLVYVLTRNGFLVGYYNSPVYRKICLNTFNLHLNPEPFKRLPEFHISHDEKYIKPFNKLVTILDNS
jgi:hypothetical protein